MQTHESDFSSFAAAVKDSVEGHAKRKGYRTTDVDGTNEIADFMHAQGLGQPHGVSEIIYKALEFRRSPKRVLLEKIAGWAFILWQRCD
jgi:hypothetical protein